MFRCETSAYYLSVCPVLIQLFQQFQKRIYFSCAFDFFIFENHKVFALSVREIGPKRPQFYFAFAVCAVEVVAFGFYQ